MRRLRPLDYLHPGLRLGVGIVTLALLEVTGFGVAQAQTLAPPSNASQPSWSEISLEGLDERVQSLVDRPVPATLPGDATARSEVNSSVSAALPTSAEVVFPEITGPVPSAASTAPREAPEGDDGNSRSSAEWIAESSPPVIESKPRVIPRHVVALRQPIERCLEAHAQMRLDSGHDSCWSMMHAFLGWGPSCEIHIGGPRGPRTNAIAWVGQNQPCGGRRLFYLDGDRIRGREGPGYQGHPAQFLAMLAQCNIDPSYMLRVNDRPVSVAQLVEEEKRTCSSQSELTFKLIGLVHYLGTEAQWTNDQGESWDIPKLLALELTQPINGAACGGTHRIMAISYAVAKRRQEGGTADGHWWRAEKYIADYHRYAMSLQNSDGSFSSDWFRQRADWGDLDRRVQTTGHILEWLVFSLPEEALQDPPIVRAVSYLTQAMSQHRNHDWEIGPKGHAIRALRLYHQRVFERAEIAVAPLAQRPQNAAQDR